mmetsp:Transcript_56574/g.150828  ORF Transcript_56574/g.150828 Transcript_56574/m.150828 type:complete len:630 (+) Transcript_56574:284-2173(+)
MMCTSSKSLSSPFRLYTPCSTSSSSSCLSLVRYSTTASQSWYPVVSTCTGSGRPFKASVRVFSVMVPTVAPRDWPTEDGARSRASAGAGAALACLSSSSRTAILARASSASSLTLLSSASVLATSAFHCSVCSLCLRSSSSWVSGLMERSLSRVVSMVFTASVNMAWTRARYWRDKVSQAFTMAMEQRSRIFDTAGSTECTTSAASWTTPMSRSRDPRILGMTSSSGHSSKAHRAPSASVARLNRTCKGWASTLLSAPNIWSKSRMTSLTTGMHRLAWASCSSSTSTTRCTAPLAGSNKCFTVRDVSDPVNSRAFKRYCSCLISPGCRSQRMVCRPLASITLRASRASSPGPPTLAGSRTTSGALEVTCKHTKPGLLTVFLKGISRRSMSSVRILPSSIGSGLSSCSRSPPVRFAGRVLRRFHAVCNTRWNGRLSVSAAATCRSTIFPPAGISPQVPNPGSRVAAGPSSSAGFRPRSFARWVAASKMDRAWSMSVLASRGTMPWTILACSRGHSTAVVLGAEGPESAGPPPTGTGVTVEKVLAWPGSEGSWWYRRSLRCLPRAAKNWLVGHTPCTLVFATRARAGSTEIPVRGVFGNSAPRSDPRNRGEAATLPSAPTTCWAAASEKAQ